MVENKLVGIDDVISLQNAESCFSIAIFSNFDFVFFCVLNKHGTEVFMDACVGNQLKLALFDHGNDLGEDSLDFVFVGSETSCGDCESEGARFEGFGAFVAIPDFNSWVYGATCDVDSGFFDFVAENVAKLKKLSLCFVIKYCPG